MCPADVDVSSRCGRVQHKLQQMDMSAMVQYGHVQRQSGYVHAQQIMMHRHIHSILLKSVDVSTADGGHVHLMKPGANGCIQMVNIRSKSVRRNDEYKTHFCNTACGLMMVRVD